MTFRGKLLIIAGLCVAALILVPGLADASFIATRWVVSSLLQHVVIK